MNDARDLDAQDLAAALEAKEWRLRKERDDAFDLATLRPTGKNRKGYKDAEKALDEFLRAQAEAEGEGGRLKGLAEVLEYLQPDWKISQSTLYEHREQGKIRCEGDGSFLPDHIDDYAWANLRRKDGRKDGSRDTFPNIQERKELARIRQIDADAGMRELKLRIQKGELIERSQVEIELAERATDLSSYFDAVFRKGAGRMIKIVGGDPQKAAELIEWLLAMRRKAMDNYARPIEGLEDEEA